MKAYLLCFVLYFALPDLGTGQLLFCSKNDECPVSATCEGGLCVCEVGKVLNLDRSKCLDMAPGIGSPCLESTQCTPLISGPAVCNEEELCSCESGYIYLNNKCVKYQGLNEPCTADMVCFNGVDLFAMTCGENGRCGCNEGYYMRGESDCRQSAKDDGKCLIDLDCENDNQYCKFTNGPLGECKRAPKIACTTDKECQKQIFNTVCADFRQNKCTCKDDLIYDKKINECVPDNSEEREVELNYFPELNIKAKPGLDQPCTDDTNCQDIRNSFCAKFRNKCTCLESFVYDKNSGNCVRGLGATCLETPGTIGNITEPECGVKHSSCNDEKNICQCPKYFIYGQYSDTCFEPTREFNLHSCDSDENCFTFGPYATCTKANSNAITTTCICNSNSIYDEELKYCKPTSAAGCKDECKYKLHSQCIVGECKCEDNYIEENHKCLPDLGYPCSLAETDCQIDSAECVGEPKICQCKEGYWKSDSRQCLKASEGCKNDCKHKPHSKCLFGECICDDNYIDENDKCLADLGYPCSLANRDCQITGAECVGNPKICQCKEGYLEGDSRQCLKDLGSCSKNDECPESATCQSGSCVCDVGKVLNLDGKKCLDVAPGIGSPCLESTQCTPLISGPAVCNEEELCSCESGYIYLNNKCVKYVGMNEPCTADMVCYNGVDLFAMICGDNGRCGCNEGYYMRGESDCRQSAKDDGECLIDLDCENEDQYCKFKYGPLGECRDAPNIACTTDQECQEQLNSNDTFCADFRQNKCTCKDDSIYDKEINECVPEMFKEPETKLQYFPELKIKAKPGLEQPCTDDTNCKEIRNSFCAKYRNKCTCLKSFMYDKKSGNCVRGLGATCLETPGTIGNTTEPECGIKHSSCNDEKNICQCPKYFVYGPYSDKCYKPTRAFKRHSCGSDENCFTFGPYATCTKANANATTMTCICNSNSIYDEELKYCLPTATTTGCKDECKHKLHSKCVVGECICEENYVEENDKCLPDLGYSCSLAQEDCQINDAECVGEPKICQCKEGFFKGDSRQCLKVLEDPEKDKCISDKQCFKLIGEGSSCFNETCICSSKYVFDDFSKQCILIRNLGDQCTNARECLTILGTSHVRCLNSACACDDDYHLSDDKTKCVADNAASSIDGRQLIFFVVLAVTTLLFFL